jgi:hypothetical protein
MADFSLRLNAEQAVQLTTHVLEQHQLRAVRNFDLRDALHSQDTACACPHHGTPDCKCNYVVLLVYAVGAPGDLPQAAGRLVIHSHAGTTWLTVPTPNDLRNPSNDSRTSQRLLRAVAEVMYEAAA